MLLYREDHNKHFLIDDVITTGATLKRVRVLYYKSLAQISVVCMAMAHS
jgi:predicted amidophosphoribosyltransferase